MTDKGVRGVFAEGEGQCRVVIWAWSQRREPQNKWEREYGERSDPTRLTSGVGNEAGRLRCRGDGVVQGAMFGE